MIAGADAIGDESSSYKDWAEWGHRARLQIRMFLIIDSLKPQGRMSVNQNQNQNQSDRLEEVQGYITILDTLSASPLSHLCLA
jgi:hypothetical protein